MIKSKKLFFSMVAWGIVICMLVACGRVTDGKNEPKEKNVTESSERKSKGDTKEQEASQESKEQEKYQDIECDDADYEGQPLEILETQKLIGSWSAEYAIDEDGEQMGGCAIDIEEDGSVYLAYGKTDDYTGQFRGTWKLASEIPGTNYPEGAILFDLYATDENRTEVTEIHTVQVFYGAEDRSFISERVEGDSFVAGSEVDYLAFGEAFG